MAASIHSPTSASEPFARAAQLAHRGGPARLGRLVRRLEAIAEELTSATKTHAERTVLRARYADLQRRVNELDGIVAGEGYEVSGHDRVARSEGGQPPPSAAPPPGAAQDPHPAEPPGGDRPQVDVVA
jgi:hypothetical protein